MRLREAAKIARMFLARIEPACVECVIAGSVRREFEEVGDIEIVARPKMVAGQKTMFTRELVSALDRLCNSLAADVENPLTFDQETKRNGPRYKRMLWAGEVAIDLFVVLPPASFGAILAIRTGPADFSKLLVTPRWQSGAMPKDLRQSEGALQRRSVIDGVEHWTRIETATEDHYFAELGLPFWPPRERTGSKLAIHLGHERRAAEKGGVADARHVSG